MFPLQSLPFIIFLSLFITSCAEIPPVITPNDASTIGNELETANVLIEEFVETPASADEEDEESDLILSRAQSLAQQHPHFAKALLDFAQEQRNENVFLNNNFVSAIWLLRRALT